MNAKTAPRDYSSIYDPEIRGLGDAPRVHGRKRGSRPAFLFEGRMTTYAEFDVHTAQVAHGLLEAGVRYGSRVAYLGKNSDLFFELLFGACRIGAVLAPVNWRLAKPEMAYTINDAEAEVLLVDREHAGVARELAGKLTSVRLVLCTDPGDSQYEHFIDWRGRQRREDPGIAVDSADAAFQLYTSGTTGLPKGVQLRHRSFYAFLAHGFSHPQERADDMGWNTWGPDDVSLVAMPVFHASGGAWGIVGVYAGAFNIVLREFDQARVIDTIRQHRVSKVVLVPSTIQMMLDHPGRGPDDFASMSDFLYGASPIPLPILERAVRELRCGFVQLYGLTETCGAVTYLPHADHQAGNPRMQSAGKPIPGARLKILEAGTQRELPLGEVGEICIHAPTIMIGYWKQPQETARTIQPDGWLRSGDAGYLDADGYLYIKDRVKDMIVSGGENIYPAEVERALFEHPGIADAAVIGVPDEQWGEAVKAMVVLRSGQHVTAEQIVAHCRERIGGYKCPKSVEFLSALPRSASGKVLKRDLREPYWKGYARRVN